MHATLEYHKLLETILKDGKHRGDRTGTGTLSIFDYKIKFDMAQGFPLITTKKIHTKSIIHELIWFLNGDTNIKYLNNNGVTIWDEWADENGDLGPVYGKQWVNFGETHKVPIGWHHGAPTNFKSIGINQIQQALKALKHNPESRRIMVSAWNPIELEQMALPPCHWAFELYTEELTLNERREIARDTLGQLEWANVIKLAHYKKTYDKHNIPSRRLSLKWHQRSVDTFLGLPFNIASYALLLNMFAQQVNMVPGTLVGDLTNVHLYDNHMDYVKKQLERDPLEHRAPQLELLKAPDMFSYKYEDFDILNYTSYPNWKNVPIAI